MTSMARINLSVKLEDLDSKDNLIEILKGNNKLERILEMLLDAQESKGPAQVTGKVPGQAWYAYNFKVPLEKLEDL